MLQNTKAKNSRMQLNFMQIIWQRSRMSIFRDVIKNSKNHEVWSSLIGHFNSQNLAVYAIDLFKIPTLNILKYISKLTSADGRFQSFQTKENITIVVDYAHTPDALKKYFRNNK